MAVTLTAAQVAASVQGLDETGAVERLAICKAQIERYAQDAPEDVQNECCYRLANYLQVTPVPYGRLRDDTFETSDMVFNQSMRRSGCHDLLSPWRSVVTAVIE